MRKPRVYGEAVIPETIRDLRDKFEYPFIDPDIPVPIGGGGGGMAHILIVSDSEPAEIQAKADYVIPQSNSSARLQDAYDDITASANGGWWSIWHAGIFDLNADVTAPTGSWIRGLGYRAAGEL